MVVIIVDDFGITISYGQFVGYGWNRYRIGDRKWWGRGIAISVGCRTTIRILMIIIMIVFLTRRGGSGGSRLGS